ncbi:MAG: hypothetical protein SX243_21870 [Acidobacteriota bacterium]|nr:hypothetical protein [Acidobacteriota bacterium]
MPSKPPSRRPPPTRLLRASLAVLCLLVSFLLVAAPAWGARPEPPTLVFDAPPELEPRVLQLQKMNPELFIPALRRTGLDDAGAPVRVVLAPESSPLAQRVPGWVAGYAYGRLGTVILLAERVPSYPNGSFEELLRHEVAHVLIDRAAGYQPVPRWFHEGLAMALAGEWGLKDRSQLGLAVWGRQEPSLQQVDRAFQGSAQQVKGAYAVSAAFLRYLSQEYGPYLPGLILQRVAAGDDFDQAFFDLTGISLNEAQSEFWAQEVFWIRWLPVLASSTTVWALITVLALWASKRRRDKNRELEAEWEAEESRQEERERERERERQRRLQEQLALLETRRLDLLDEESEPIH